MRRQSSEMMIGLSTRRPRLVTWAMVLSTLALVALAGLPSLFPQSLPALNGLVVDTDPENMLAEDEPVRRFHDAMKREFSLYDMVVVGIVNERDPDGVFNPDSLRRIYALTEFAKTLSWPDPDNPDKRVGVVEADVIAPSTVDDIAQAGLGAVSFDWLMAQPPETREQALAVRERIRRLPLLDGTLLSEDGKALALYLPLTSKDLSYRVREALLAQVADWPADGDQVYITGLPVAEDTFGVEMFYQMAISAPLAMLVVFLAMWWFFRNLRLIVAPMIVALVTVGATMALLVISGQTIHIMSSMIPVFLMPIAVLDAVHILSEFFDRYQRVRDRRRVMGEVVRTLFTPMLFTTLTTMAGFGSLALTPIPPVQVFGVFVAIGVFLAWLWTLLFIPAYVMLIPEHRLAGFGRTGESGEAARTPLARGLLRLGWAMVRHARLVLLAAALVVAVAGYGIGRITINDNPVEWFTESHPIRVADRVLNAHFGGTYMAYLALEAGEPTPSAPAYLEGLLGRLEAAREAALADGIEAAGPVFQSLAAAARETAATRADAEALLAALAERAEAQRQAAAGAERIAWEEAAAFLDSERQRGEVFKSPEVLRYIARLQAALAETGVVGKSSSLADLVKTVHRELLLGDAAAFRVPDSPAAVAQTLLTFQNSHRPQDLWRLVTPDYRKASVWVQLKSGDNRDMSRVAAALDGFVAANPPPVALDLNWFGLNYINVVWQDRMVSGMLEALLGGFLVVLLMMALLFRSLLWGLLSMVPLSLTIGLIYGLIGLLGKDYDMPVAVLSALSLGLSVDYAIHFLARTRAAQAEAGSWATAVPAVFGEPARAIARNAVVLGVGFLPLLAAPLVPYQTVGLFIAAILVTAGLGSLLILPALVTLLERRLFPAGARPARDPSRPKEIEDHARS